MSYKTSHVFLSLVFDKNEEEEEEEEHFLSTCHYIPYHIYTILYQKKKKKTLRYSYFFV
jgi:hypothetical protein